MSSFGLVSSTRKIHRNYRVVPVGIATSSPVSGPAIAARTLLEHHAATCVKCSAAMEGSAPSPEVAHDLCGDGMAMLLAAMRARGAR